MNTTLCIIAREGHPTTANPYSMPSLVLAMRDVSAAMQRVTSQTESNALVARSLVIACAVAAVLTSEDGQR